MARDGALQSLELPSDPGVDTDLQPVGSGIEGHQGIARSVGPARILRKGHGAVVGGELDLQIMLPMLAQMLQILLV